MAIPCGSMSWDISTSSAQQYPASIVIFCGNDVIKERFYVILMLVLENHPKEGKRRRGKMFAKRAEDELQSKANVL